MSYMNKDFDPGKSEKPEETEVEQSTDLVEGPSEDPRWEKTEKPEDSPTILERLANANTTTRVTFALIALALLFLVMIAIWRATSPSPIRPTSMNNTAELVRRALYEEDYDEYVKLFKDSHQNAVLETDFRDLSNLATDGASSAEYSIVRMSNGRQLLVAMEQNYENDEYQVLYVVEVPMAMKELFTDRTLSPDSGKMIPVPVGEIPATQPSTSAPVETTIEESEPEVTTEEVTTPAPTTEEPVETEEPTTERTTRRTTTSRTEATEEDE